MKLRFIFFLGINLVCATVAIAEPTATGLTEISSYKTWTALVTDLKVSPQMATLCWHPPFVGHPSTANVVDDADRFVSVYANELATRHIRSGSNQPFPEGSIVVKEKRQPRQNDEALSLAVMVKRIKGFNSANADWEFAMVRKSGEVIRDASKLSDCYSCHQRASYGGDFTVDSVFVSRYQKK